MTLAENELLQVAQTYLKKTYSEDTVMMVITRNDVSAGTGKLAVDCTVSVDGQHSDWSKVFHFANGAIVDMDYQRR